MICAMWNCPRTSDGHCPMCSPRPAYIMPPSPIYSTPQGCICPPTSEKTCENSFCPRKNIRIGATGTAVPSTQRQSELLSCGRRDGNCQCQQLAECIHEKT